jgi:kynureninase
MSGFEANREFARALDDADPLRPMRERFSFPQRRDGRPPVYVCGNSLGLMPDTAAKYVDEAMTQWATLGVEGHFRGPHPWLNYHRLAAAGFAELTGADKREVVAMNTLTVNLHLLMASFYRPRGSRNKIVIESTAFPSDYFAVQSQIRLHGLEPTDCLLEWRPREDGLLSTEDLGAILEEHGESIALLLLPGVQYLSGQVLDMQTHCRMARDNGCHVGLDLAHAIGNVPLRLHDWAPDFAAWCTYKYLNAGPGAIAGAFVHAKHLTGDGTRQLTGWWGHDEATRFLMRHDFEPAAGAERWQLSNPPILSLAPVVASLEIFLEAGMDALRRKSLQQTDYLRFLLDESFAGRLSTVTPMDARGCQLSLAVVDDALDARSIFRSLEAAGVVADWREPNVIRVAPVPLYNSFEDLFELSLRLAEAFELHEQK